MARRYADPYRIEKPSWRAATRIRTGSRKTEQDTCERSEIDDLEEIRVAARGQDTCKGSEKRRSLRGWGDGEMGGWGDGETRRSRNPVAERETSWRSRNPVSRSLVADREIKFREV